MAEGCDRAEWKRFAPLIAAVCNSNPWREEPVTVKQINPYLQEPERENEGPEVDAVDIALMLCGQQAIDFFKAHDEAMKSKSKGDRGFHG